MTPTNSAFVVKLDNAGSFVWAKTILDPDNLVFNSIVLDNTNNVLLCGVFSAGNGPEVFDLDPGPGTYTVALGWGATGTFALKLDNSGNTIWTHAWTSGSGSMLLGEITCDNNSSIFLSGNAQGPMDMDPGPAVSNATANTGPVIIKLSPAGNFIWGKQFSFVDVGNSSLNITADNAGSVYMVGLFQNTTADFDPGPGQCLFTPYYMDHDAFIVKLDSNGSFNWAKKYGGWGSEHAWAVDADNNGNVYLTGQFTQSVSFNPTTNDTLTSNGDRDIFFIKLDTAGNFFFVKQIGGIGLDEPNDINTDASGNVFLSGLFRETVDFDPAATVYTLSTGGPVGDAYIAKYSPVGNFLWAKQVVNAPCNDQQFSVELDNQGNVYGCGRAYCGPVNFGNNFTFSGGVLYIGKWTQDSCGAFAANLASLSNITCASPGFASVTVLGDPPYTFSWSSAPTVTTNTLNFVNPGMQILTVSDSYCTQQISFMVTGPIYTLAAHDLDVNLISNNFSPGFTRPVIVDGYNKSCIPVSGQLVVILDTLLDYQSANPVPLSVSVSGDTLTWLFNNLSHTSSHITPTIHVTTSILAQIGDTIDIKLEMLPIAGDATPADNIKVYKKTVIGSYDPNDKQVYPPGNCIQKFVLNEPLTYTIRFQNTGTALAYSVSIRDTIDTDLDLKTMQIISTSHSMTTKVTGNAVDFRFDDIMLPDSNSNEPASHGYVVYKISPKASSTNGTIIKNTSAIYFDYNAPVLTNTTSNTIFNSFVNCLTLAVRDNNNAEHLEIYPNPSSGVISIHGPIDLKNSSVSVIDVNGKRVSYHKAIDQNTSSIDLGELKKGFYIIELRKENGNVIRRKLILE